jgi:hypothetical protein
MEEGSAWRAEAMAVEGHNPSGENVDNPAVVAKHCTPPVSALSEAGVDRVVHRSPPSFFAVELHVRTVSGSADLRPDAVRVSSAGCSVGFCS